MGRREARANITYSDCMKRKVPSKNRVILTRAFALLALPVALSAAAASITRSGTIDSLLAPGADIVGHAAPAAQSGQGAAEKLFQGDWRAASPEVYARIAQAFEAQALDGADLIRVECRSSLCKIIYEANVDIQVRRILPRCLAQSFNSMVTVHAGKNDGRETLVYVDIPSRN